jgi:hypothetical protein
MADAHGAAVMRGRCCMLGPLAIRSELAICAYEADYAACQELAAAAFNVGLLAGGAVN